MSGIFKVPGGKDLSPQLSWSGAPAETKSYTVTMYDPDAPSGSGFWHWAVTDIPASVTGLPTGAGDGTSGHLPTGAFHIPNDARLARFVGGAPPPGDARHRYVIVVQAIGIEKVGQLQVQADSTPAWLGPTIPVRRPLDDALVDRAKARRPACCREPLENGSRPRAWCFAVSARSCGSC